MFSCSIIELKNIIDLSQTKNIICFEFSPFSALFILYCDLYLNESLFGITKKQYIYNRKMKKFILTYGLLGGFLIIFTGNTGTTCPYKTFSREQISEGSVAFCLVADDISWDSMKQIRHSINLSYKCNPHIDPFTQIVQSVNIFPECLRSPSENYRRTSLRFSSLLKI